MRKERNRLCAEDAVFSVKVRYRTYRRSKMLGRASLAREKNWQPDFSLSSKSFGGPSFCFGGFLFAILGRSGGFERA
jgi:hypothetical protein